MADTASAKSWRVLLAAAVLPFLAVPAWAADQGASGASDFLFLCQVVILILVGRTLGEIMQRLGQSSVMGQLIAGILLGPSVFGAIYPQAQQAVFPSDHAQKAMIEGMAQFGVLMLLLLAGMQTDLRLVRRLGRSAAVVSLSGICIPFAFGFLLGQALPERLLPHQDQRLIASLFLGTALSISSVKIVVAVIREMNFLRRKIGQAIITSAVIDDTIGWVIIAIIFSLSTRNRLDAGLILRSILGTAAFLVVSLSIGRRLVFKAIRWANDWLVSEGAVITVILVLMSAMALVTHLIGIHTVLGAFVSGILVGQSPILTHQIEEQLRGLITSLFMPVFFGLAGLTADLTVLGDRTLLLLTIGLILVASLGKFSGAFLGGRLSGMTLRESFALACGMNARGSSEVIVATIGLSMGIISQALFTMIVAVAVVTTMAMPPMLRRALAGLPLDDEEKTRLDREEFEEKGFVANLERILLAVDQSASGQFAARLAGLVAGSRGLPATVLHLGDAPAPSAQTPEAVLEAGARTTAEPHKEKPPEVEITSRRPPDRAEQAVADEARKGFDLLVIGTDRTSGAGGTFHPEVGRLATGFAGPLAVAAARGAHGDRPADGRLRILVPITGTAASRRGAEMAVALARANQVPLTALYISLPVEGPDRRRHAPSPRLHEEAVLKDVVELAECYDTKVVTVVRAGIAPDEAILRELRGRRCNLMVMGVHRRPGEHLLFGNVAAALLERSPASLLFVAS